MMEPNRFIQFIGGKSILFSLIILILTGLVISIFSKISFVFYPFFVILSTVFPPVILAFIAYYLLNPIVNQLGRIHINRLWGIVIIIILFSGAVTGLVMLSVSALEDQINTLIIEFPKYINKINKDVQNLLHNSIFESSYTKAKDWVEYQLVDLPNILMAYITDTKGSLSNFASTLVRIVVSLVTFPFVLFFLLKDAEKFKQFFLHLFPKKFRKEMATILQNMDTQVGSYIQGQIIVALCIGVMLFIGYLIIGLDYAITLAIVAAVTNVVPYIGPIIAITPAIIIAVVTSPFMILKLAIVWAVVQFSEGHFISPNIMGRTMKIHPLTIMFVLLIAGRLFGLFGIILAIPGYAILKVFVEYAFYKFKKRFNQFYDEGYEP